MNEKTEKQATDILSSLENEETAEEIKEIAAKRDSKEAVRDELFSFLRGHMSRISESEKLRAAIQEKLLAQVERDELTYDQLVGLFSTINRHLRDHTDSIMSILKPVPGAASPLSDSITHVDTDADKFEEAFRNMDPETLRALDTLMRMVSKDKNVKNVSTQDYDYDDLPDSLSKENSK